MGATSSVIGEEALSSIRLIDLKHLEALKTFPRYPENKDLTITLNQLTQEEYDRILIVFISHCWLRGWSGAEGWDGRPHPDSVNDDKYWLCLSGIQSIKRGMAPDMEKVYIWLDFGCIDQDGDPAGELKLLDKIVQISDCIFTPLYDKSYEEWDYPAGGWTNYFEEYKAPAWTGNPFSYVERGWCRVEMFYAANIPVLQDSEERRNKMRAGLKFQREQNRRPHIMYGTKEHYRMNDPKILPPLQNTYFEQYHPEKGSLTKDSDRQHIIKLVQDLKPYMKFVEEGYEGEYNENDERHGHGIYRYEDGDVYEGEWKNGNEHGHGKYTSVTGDMYEGEWKDGLKHGHGIYRYAKGDVHEGGWQNGKKHGHGIMRYAGGVIVFEGEYRDGTWNGYGTYKWSSGEGYEGEYVNGKRKGRGIWRHPNGDFYEAEWDGYLIEDHVIKTFTNGNVYEGQFKHSKMDGHGIMKFANGDVYEGEFEVDKMHGHGVMKYASGEVVEGEWEDGEFQELKVEKEGPEEASPDIPVVAAAEDQSSNACTN